MTTRTATKPRKRSARTARQARSRHTVETILQGGARVLAERGWAGFTTNAVAGRAGVSIGSLYEYFRNKEALRDAIVTRHLDAGERLLTEAAAGLHLSAPTSAERSRAVVRALIEGFVRLHADDPALHRELSTVVPLLPEHRVRVEGMRERLVGLLASVLTADAARPQRTAMVIVDIVEALTHRWIVEDAPHAKGAPLPEDEMREEIEAVVMGYLERRG